MSAAVMQGKRPPQDGQGYEEKDANPRSLFLFGLSLAALIAGVMLLLWWLLTAFSHHPPQALAPRTALETGRSIPPEPRLQSNPQLDLEIFQAEEDSILQGYGWVDRNAGIVRVPVDTAMKMLLQRGLRTRQPASAEGQR